MLNLPPNVSILLHRGTININKSFDGLIGLVRGTFQADPLSPTLFVFFNKTRNKIKILYWDNDGFVIWYKRLEKGTFQIPLSLEDTTSVSLTRAQLAMLLEGIDFSSTKQRKRFFKKSA